MYGYNTDAYFDDIAPRAARIRQDNRLALELIFHSLTVDVPCGLFEEHIAHDLTPFLRGRSNGP